MNEELQTELSPEEAKASLGLATRLGEQSLMFEAQQQALAAPVESQEAPEQAATPETQEEPTGGIDAKLDEFKDEMNQTLRGEIGKIRGALMELVEDEEEKPETEIDKLKKEIEEVLNSDE